MEEQYYFTNPNKNLNVYLSRVPEGLVEAANGLNGKYGLLTNALNILRNSSGPNIAISHTDKFIKCTIKESGMTQSYRLIDIKKKDA